MTEQWRQQMQRKMADYRRPAPKVAWAEVEKAVATGRKGRVVPLYVRRVAAAVVLMLIVGSGGWLLLRDQADGPVVTHAIEPRAVGGHAIGGHAIGGHASERGSQGTVATLGSVASCRDVQDTVATHRSVASCRDVQDTVATHRSVASSRDSQDSAATHRSVASYHDVQNAAAAHGSVASYRRSSANRLTAKVYLSNGLAGSNKSDMLLAMADPGEVTPEDSPRPISDPDPGNTGGFLTDGSDGTNGKGGSNGKDGANGLTDGDERGGAGGQGNSGGTGTDGSPTDQPTVTPPNTETTGKATQTDRHVHHRQPLRFGLSLRYRLNRWWSVESGVTVAQHSSEITETTGSSTTHIDQRLVYVGVPLHVSYLLWGNRHFALYASAGGTVEKMVWGRQDTEQGTENTTQGRTSQRVSIKPLQLSLDAAIGAEYRFSDRLSIYAEPGLGYYFDNGSLVSTIYQEQPLNLNINLGVRMSFR